MEKSGTSKKFRGMSWQRLTVHINGPSVPFADPKKEYRTTSEDGKKVKSKQRIMNTLTFKHVHESEVAGIINEVKGKYPNLNPSPKMPEGIKWYLSQMK